MAMKEDEDKMKTASNTVIEEWIKRRRRRMRERKGPRARIKTTKRNDFRIRSSESAYSASVTNKALTNSADSSD